MNVFVTGASGFIGSAVVRELIAAGHQVTGLARSDQSAEALGALGASVRRGSLEDLASLRDGAAAADAVLHCAFVHNFDNYTAAAEADRQAIETMGAALSGSDRPLIVSSGTGNAVPGQPMTENDRIDPAKAGVPRLSEVTALKLADQGLRASVMCFPPTVHGEGDWHGFIPRLIQIAREKGVAGYPGDGSNRWPAVHRLDAARLCRLALESAPGGIRIHAVGDEGVPTRQIAEAIGRRLNLPVESVPLGELTGHFGWMGPIFAADLPASSALTQARFSWHPEQPGLLADLEQGHYFAQ